jgi:hypothetical protein
MCEAKALLLLRHDSAPGLRSILLLLLLLLID